MQVSAANYGRLSRILSTERKPLKNTLFQSPGSRKCPFAAQEAPQHRQQWSWPPGHGQHNQPHHPHNTAQLTQMVINDGHGHMNHTHVHCAKMAKKMVIGMVKYIGYQPYTIHTVLNHQHKWSSSMVIATSTTSSPKPSGKHLPP